ncbi:MAG: WbqC family protein [Bacteroidia bacterium]
MNQQRKIAIMQPYIFPFIGYFQLINAVDKFIIYDDVNFIKQGWINRNNILVNGKSFSFSIPLHDISSFRLINETEVNEKLYLNWVNKFMKTIELNYAKAPYLQNIFNLIRSVFLSGENKISRIAGLSINKVCNYLQLPITIINTSAVYNNAHLKNFERVLDICKIEEADTYVNASGGQKLYKKEKFKEQSINLFFIKPISKKYLQFKNEFVPFLSIIDVLMFNSIEETRELLKAYELI